MASYTYRILQRHISGIKFALASSYLPPNTQRAMRQELRKAEKIRDRIIEEKNGILI